MYGKNAIGFALDPVDMYPFRDEIVVRKAVPFFPIANSQLKVFDWRDIDTRLIFLFLNKFFPCILRGALGVGEEFRVNRWR